MAIAAATKASLLVSPLLPRGYSSGYSLPLTSYASAPLAYASPVAHAAPAVHHVIPASSSSQHHSQDEYGNYNYGYNNINSAKQESGNAYGGVTGSYSYTDGYGQPQQVNYVADDYGFRATGSNLVNSADAINTGHRYKRSIYGSSLLVSPYTSAYASPYTAAYSAPLAYASPVVHTAPAVHAAPAVQHVIPASPSFQHHSQDEYGNYNYGYNNINSAKQESGNAYGGVTGSYSYTDGYGQPQQVNYVADDYGFRATGSNLVNSADAINTGHRYKRSIYGSSLLVSPYTSAYASPYTAAYSAPLAYASPVVHTAPAVHAAPAIQHAIPASSSSQHHSQDEYGNYNYGYNNINSAKQESGNAYGGVTGSYSYTDGYGQPQQVNYVADDYGFRATGSNLVNSADAINTGHRYRRSVYPGYTTYNQASLRPAILTQIKLNPGHAIFYRVD